MAPKRAIVREPGESYAKCISCHPLRDTINTQRAREQHARYCAALRELGLEVIHIPREDLLPDSCFVEDNAVVHHGKALICRMARPERREEVGAVVELLQDMVKVKKASAPATVEGGDVIHLDDRLISGMSQRTNAEGIRQMRDWLEVDVSVVRDPNIVHLKSHITFLGKETMVATKEYASHPALEGFSVITIPPEEAYAADTLAIGDTVLMASGRPRSHDLVRKAGFRVMPLDVSEFEKCDGALTCLSILL